MTKAFWAAVLLVSLVGVAGAQPPPCHTDTEPGAPTFLGYRAYEENDSIIKNGEDERYTQGLRVEIGFRPSKVPCKARGVDNWLRHLWFSPDVWEGTPSGLSLVLGQNLYTPRIITSTVIDSNDRSFSDFTYVGARFSETSLNQRVRHSLEIDIGALGVAGLGKGAQGGLHTLKMDRIPKGWNSTEPSGFGVNAYYRSEQRVTKVGKWSTCWHEGIHEGKSSDENCVIDLTFGDALELGNVRTSAGLHAAARLGWGLSGFPAAAIQAAAAPGHRRRPLEVGAIVGVEGRAIAYTALVHGTEGTQDFSASRLVGDLRYGAYGRYNSLRVTWQRVKRSHEFSIPRVEDRSQSFGSISVSYEPLVEIPWAPHDFEKPWLFRGWQFELGMGANFGGPRIVIGNDRGLGSQIAGRKALYESPKKDMTGHDVAAGPWAIVLGLELAAATVETSQTPGEPGNRSDLFLQQQAVTLGITFRPRDEKYGRFGVRIGTALKGAAQIETVFHPTENGRTSEDKAYYKFDAPRGGWLVGAQYFAPLESHLSLGVDVAYHSVRVIESVPDLVAPKFWKWIVAVQLRP
jgi:hypothetical protein